MKEMKFRIIVDSYSGNLNFYAHQVDRSGDHTRMYYAKPVLLEFEEVPEGHVRHPFISIPEEFIESAIQALMKDLEHQGFRTDRAAHAEGQLGATEYHLEDLRQLLKLKGSRT